jgi:malate:Na+ symporter
MAFGYSLKTAFFYIVVPILGGGMGEGVIPLSAAYSSTLGGDAAGYLARLIPAVVIANIVAIISAGVLRRLGDKKPGLDGKGELIKVRRADSVDEKAPAVADALTATTANHAVGVMTICTMFVAGTLISPLVHLPAPILVIIFSVILKVLNVVPESVETSARTVYAIVSKYFIFPLMFGVSMIYIPLESVISVLSVGYVITCIAVVLTMGLCGFFVGKAVGMYPIDASLVTLCHSGQGGTGDVAILSAANRMMLMPFAQVSTRIGGVVTVITAASLIHLAG